MCGFRDQTKVRSCLWRLNTFYQKLLIILWYLFLSRYHFAWSIGTPSVDVSRSFVEKHILYIESSSRGTNHSIPFVNIKQGFDVVQDTPYLIKQNGKNSRKRHLFLATSDIAAAKKDLVLAFSDKVNRRVNRVGPRTNTFVVYNISIEELMNRSHAVDAFDLDIKFGTKYYSIKNCKHSDSGTFNLGAEVMNWTARVYRINHVENVVLWNPKPCKDYPPQNPPGTCRN